MKNKWVITGLSIAGLILVLMVVWACFGGFRRISFERMTIGGETIVFLEEHGDYSRSAEAMEIVCGQLRERFGIEAARSFGIYYDDPAVVPADARRYEAGCFVPEGDSTDLAAVGEVFNVRVEPEAECLVTVFPYYGKPSIFIGLMKVYPALQKYLRESGLEERMGPVMEIYDTAGRKIEYRVKLTAPKPEEKAAEEEDEI